MAHIVRTVGGWAVAIGSFAYMRVVRNDSLHEEQKPKIRDSLFVTVREMVKATMWPPKFHDTRAAEGHAELVRSLSSHAYVESEDSEKEIREQVQTASVSYFAGYLFEALNGIEAKGLPVFKFSPTLKVILPGGPFQGFLFAGRAGKLFDREARDAITSGHYVHCSSILDKKAPDIYEGYRKEDVIITGTTDTSRCREFAADYFRDVIYRFGSSEGRRLPLDHPLNDTRVFEFNRESNGLTEIGDITELDPSKRRNIGLTNYTICLQYGKAKTRQSHGSYKDLDAIVLGINNKEVCTILSVEHIRAQVQAVKQAGDKAREAE